MADETPALTVEAPGSAIDAGLVVNGSIDLRKTHPNLYRTVMTFAVLCVALGFNFWAFTPTYLIYGMPNEVWGSIFLALGLATIFLANFYRRLRLLRGVMGLVVAYMLFLAAGTSQPFLEGNGSLQLPLLYAGLAALQIPLLIEPFINPWTARRD